MSMLRFSKVADVVVRKLANIQPGESVVILADTGTNLDIAHAYLAASIAVGAKGVLVLEQERSIIDYDPPGPLQGALREADVVLGLGRSLFSRSAGAQDARKRGARMLLTDPRGMEDYLIDGIIHVDQDLMLENANILVALLEKADRCDITSANGTSLTASIKGRPILLGDGMLTKPGETDYYPGIQVNLAAIEETINGTVIVDGSMSTLGKVNEPFAIHIKNGKVTSIEGGTDAARYRKHIEEQEDPKLAEVCHYSFGLNPKATLSGNIYEDERYLGCLDIGFGSQSPDFGGTVGASPHHVDIVIASPTLTLDGQVVIHENVLNPELGFHQL